MPNKNNFIEEEKGKEKDYDLSSYVCIGFDLMPNKNNFIEEEKGKEKDYDLSLAVGSRSGC